MSTLSFIASMPAGSGVVFDFAVDPTLLNPEKGRLSMHSRSA